MKPWGPCGTGHWDAPSSRDEPRHRCNSEQEPRAPAALVPGTGPARAEPEAAAAGLGRDAGVR